VLGRVQFLLDPNLFAALIDLRISSKVVGALPWMKVRGGM